jgi:hypothetical protein
VPFGRAGSTPVFFFPNNIKTKKMDELKQQPMDKLGLDEGVSQ